MKSVNEHIAMQFWEMSTELYLQKVMVPSSY